MSDDERSGLENETGGMNRGSLLKRLALGSAALSVPSLAAVEAAIAAPDGCDRDGLPEASEVEVRIRQPRDDEPVLRARRYGAQDACSLLGCSYQWTGSTKADVSEMVNAFNSAISSKAAGIAAASST